MKTVWKYPIQVNDTPQNLKTEANLAQFGGKGRIVHVGVQADVRNGGVFPEGVVQVWVEHGDPEAPLLPMVQVYGTGHDIPDDATWLATCLDAGLVWHLYDVTRPYLSSLVDSLMAERPERLTHLMEVWAKVNERADAEDTQGIRALVAEAGIEPGAHVGNPPDSFTALERVEWVLGQWASIIDGGHLFALNSARNISHDFFRQAQEPKESESGEINPWAESGQRTEWPDGFGAAVLHDLPPTPEPLPPVTMYGTDDAWWLGGEPRNCVATVSLDFSEAGIAALAERIETAIRRKDWYTTAADAARIAAEVVGCNVVIERIGACVERAEVDELAAWLDEHVYWWCLDREPDRSWYVSWLDTVSGPIGEASNHPTFREALIAAVREVAR